MSELRTERPEGQPTIGGIVEHWYACWGTGSGTLLDVVAAHIRSVRPSTRLWLDTIMPVAVIAVLTEGEIPWRTAIVAVLAMNFIHIGATLLNDVKDRDTDGGSTEILRRTRPIATGVIAPRHALIEAVICVLIGVVVTVFARWQLTVAAAALAVLIAQHELPPIRTQSRPIISQLAGLIGLAGIVAAIVLAVGAAPRAQAWPYLLFTVVYLGIGEMLAKDVRDADNDAAGGKLTTAVKYGPATATAAAAVAYAVATGCWLWFTACAPPGVATGWLLVAAVLLLGWVAWSVNTARLLGQHFDKSVARRLHRGSALVFCVVNVVLLTGYLTR
ncbi:UbiA family prenyltransferase [Nocardia sp. NPDC051321]|uniref:UbiA family prenyltransferase n=1 Tax=Nocardia sp. NPDC051321 TaxID=3364323 RepID=UPI0037B4BE68